MDLVSSLGTIPRVGYTLQFELYHAAFLDLSHKKRSTHTNSANSWNAAALRDDGDAGAPPPLPVACAGMFPLLVLILPRRPFRHRGGRFHFGRHPGECRRALDYRSRALLVCGLLCGAARALAMALITAAAAQRR